MSLLKIIPVVLGACATVIIIYDAVKNNNEKIRTIAIRSVMFLITAFTGGFVALQLPAFTQLQNSVNQIDNNVSQAQADVNQIQNNVNQIQTNLNQRIEALPTSAPQAVARRDLSPLPVGTIVASMLPPDRFDRELAAMNLPGVWAPADGRNVANTSYADNINSRVPDLRGVFLRGLNIFDPQQPSIDMDQLDPDYPPVNHSRRVRLAGEFEADSLAEHSHPLGNRKNLTDGAIGSSGQTIIDFNQFTERDGLRTREEGRSKETRPKNVAIYYYIKVK